MPINQEAYTVKLSTILLFTAGLIVPLWPISLPFFWWLSWRSYKKGGLPEVSLYELEKAKELLDKGAITKDEFEAIKQRTRGISA